MSDSMMRSFCVSVEVTYCGDKSKTIWFYLEELLRLKTPVGKTGKLLPANEYKVDIFGFTKHSSVIIGGQPDVKLIGTWPSSVCTLICDRIEIV